MMSQVASTSEALGLAPVTRLDYVGSESRLGLGISSQNGGRTEARNNEAGMKMEQGRAPDGIRTAMHFGKHFTGEDAHLPLATTLL